MFIVKPVLSIHQKECQKCLGCTLSIQKYGTLKHLWRDEENLQYFTRGIDVQVFNVWLG
jgi:hypothetical protein